MKFPKEFLLGASTAAHQVEGNNRYSDLWAQEQMEHSSFAEPSNDAVDHYHRYEEDIALMAGAGLNAYRFSIEWARVEPQEGCFDESEYFITHSEYRFYYNLQKLLVFKIQILQQIRFNKFQFYYKLQPIGRFIKFFLYHF